MAFRSDTLNLNPIRTQLQQLLDEIKFQQQKELQQAALQGK